MKQVDANLDNMLNTIIFDGIVKVAMQQFVLRFAFLALPVINPIFGMILGFVGQGLFNTMSEFFNFQAIDGEVTSEVAAYNLAVQGLKAALLVPQGDHERDQVLADAKANFQKSLAALISIRPARLHRHQD